MHGFFHTKVVPTLGAQTENSNYYWYPEGTGTPVWMVVATVVSNTKVPWERASDARFVADEMMRGCCRELRLFGLDVECVCASTTAGARRREQRHVIHRRLVDVAEAEERVVLTRDAGLVARRQVAQAQERRRLGRVRARDGPRLALARAFLKDAPILILDEATSALDTESEAMVQQALAELVKGRTTLSIAHPFSTIRIADRILVFKDGRIVSDGSHEQLQDLDPTYQAMVRGELR